jgi:hypothetical protein
MVPALIPLQIRESPGRAKCSPCGSSYEDVNAFVSYRCRNRQVRGSFPYAVGH